MGARCSNSFLIVDHAFRSLCNYVFNVRSIRQMSFSLGFRPLSLHAIARKPSIWEVWTPGFIHVARAGWDFLEFISSSSLIYSTRAKFSHSLAFRTNWQYPRSLLRRANERNVSYRFLSASKSTLSGFREGTSFLSVEPKCLIDWNGILNDICPIWNVLLTIDPCWMGCRENSRCFDEPLKRRRTEIVWISECSGWSKCKLTSTLTAVKTQHTCWLQLSFTWCVMMNRSSFTCCCSISPERFRTDGSPGAAITASVLAVAISPVATLENALVLVSFWRTPSLLTPANVLLISLAMTDLGTGLITAPLFSISSIAKLMEDEGLFCKVTPVYMAAATCLSGISLTTLTAISVERYTALRVHLRYNEVVTMRRVCVVAMGMWIVGISVAAAGATSTVQVTIIGSVIIIPLCLAATAFCYIKIHRVVRRHQPQISAQIPRQIGQQQGENSFDMKVFKKSYVDMLVIYVLFLVHFTPLVVVSLIVLMRGATIQVLAVSDLAETLLLVNSALNPLLYCWRSQAVRSAVKETAQKLFCRSATLSE